MHAGITNYAVITIRNCNISWWSYLMGNEGFIWFGCGYEKSYCELLWVVSCKKTKNHLVRNYCKTIWNYQMIKF
jgi:hypothetical protein